MALSDFAQRLLGFPAQLFDGQSANPVAASNPSAAALAQPTMQQLQQQDMQDAGMQRVGQLGMLLMAAGQRMTPKERATILAQAPQYMDGVQRDAMTAAQTRLMNMRAQQEQSDLERRTALIDRMKSEPDFAEKFNITPEALATLSPSSLEQIVVNRATQDPIDRALKIAQINAATKPKFEKIGADYMGQDQYGWLYPDGTVKPYSQSSSGELGATGSVSNSDALMTELQGKSGETAVNVIRKHAPMIADEVAKIASGQMQFPLRKQGTPTGNLISTLVQQVDPSWTQMTFNNRQDISKKYTSGREAEQLDFGNTAIKHLLELRSQIPSLNNYQGFPGAGLVNKIGNARLEGSRNAGKLKAFDATAGNAAGEIAGFYGAGTGHERDAVKSLFDPSMGPDELRAVIDEQIRDIFAKTTNLQNRWDEAMGPYGKNKKIIWDDTNKLLLEAYGKNQELPQNDAPTGNNLPPGVKSITPIQ